jgi:hypothetical protein
MSSEAFQSPVVGEGAGKVMLKLPSFVDIVATLVVFAADSIDDEDDEESDSSVADVDADDEFTVNVDVEMDDIESVVVEVVEVVVVVVVVVALSEVDCCATATVIKTPTNKKSIIR